MNDIAKPIYKNPIQNVKNLLIINSNAILIVESLIASQKTLL